MQSFIETSCIDEQIIPAESHGSDEAIPFGEWGRGVCDRLADELTRDGKGK